MSQQPAVPDPARHQPHFTISFAGASHAWAAWIGEQLSLQGYQFSLVRWDPPVDVPLSVAFAELSAAPGRIVLVLDDWYFQTGARTEAEWTAALRDLVQPRRHRVTVVDVAGRPLPQTAAVLRPVGLLNLDETEARRRLFAALGADTSAIRTVGPDGSPPAHRFPNDPPVVWQAPRRNVRFTGRESLLEEVHSRFAASRVRTTVLALHGVPGVGKTQIADEYVHRFGNEYDVVWYVNASARTLARGQFADLAGPLGLPTGQELGERIRAVREALRTGKPYRRWLIVLDGAEDAGQIAQLLPDGAGKVLVTTRSDGWDDQGAELIEVEPFERTESLSFLHHRAPRLSEEEAALLAAEMEDFPLLLDQSAAWLARNPATGFPEYLERLHRGFIDVNPGADYPSAFPTVWSVTLDSLYDTDPAAYELLGLLAFFSPDTIPVRLLRTAGRGDLPPHLDSIVSDPSAWNTALRRLREVAALRIDYEDSPQLGDVLTVGRVRMHRLYQSVIRQNMGEGEREKAAAVARQVLASANPRNPVDRPNWGRYDELIPHLETSGALTSDDPAVHELVLDCAEYLRVRGEYVSGWNLCRDFVRHLRGRLEPTDRTLLVAEHQHANMLRRMGRYAEAADVGRHIVQWLENDLRGTTPDLLRAQDGLAGSLMGLGAYEEACALFEQEAATAAAELGTEAVPRTLSARSNHGVALSLLGRYEEALTLHREVLERRRRLLGEQHAQTLYSTLRYAWTLRLLGRYDEAVSVQTLNARRHAQVLDKYHEQTLHAEHNLALCLRRTGEAEFAEALMRSVVERSRRKLGPEHPETLMVCSDYAMLLRRHGSSGPAAELAESTAALYRDLLGADHPYTIGTEGNCGLLRWQNGDTAEALAPAERSLRAMTDAVGEDHPWALGCGLNVIGARHLAGADEDAVRLARELLPRAEQALGPWHPLPLGVRAALAQDLHCLGRENESAVEEHAALELATEAYGEEHLYPAGLRRGVRPYWDFEPQPI